MATMSAFRGVKYIETKCSIAILRDRPSSKYFSGFNFANQGW